MTSPDHLTASTHPWIVAHIGARENYAIPRALHRGGNLELLLTDLWLGPRLSGIALRAGRAFRRYHCDLEDAPIASKNLSFLAFEIFHARKSPDSWELFIARNHRFQEYALEQLQRLARRTPESNRTLFSFSYAARDLFEFAKRQGWRTVLGQIDPGPGEERIVDAEHRHYPEARSRWCPAPAGYWDDWQAETELADVVMVNSE